MVAPGKTEQMTLLTAPPPAAAPAAAPPATERWKRALAATAEAIDRADQNGDPTWKTLAMAAICSLRDSRATFTADDVWNWLARHYPGVATHDGRALGAVMKSAAAMHLIEKTGEYLPSTRRHLAPIPVWRRSAKAAG